MKKGILFLLLFTVVSTSCSKEGASGRRDKDKYEPVFYEFDSMLELGAVAVTVGSDGLNTALGFTVRLDLSKATTRLYFPKRAQIGSSSTGTYMMSVAFKVPGTNLVDDVGGDAEISVEKFDLITNETNTAYILDPGSVGRTFKIKVKYNTPKWPGSNYAMVIKEARAFLDEALTKPVTFPFPPYPEYSIPYVTGSARLDN